jgi:hypothetical protein
MALSAAAEGSASAGRTAACHAGPNKAISPPIVKQEKAGGGVMTPSHARAESEIQPANAIDRATSATIRNPCPKSTD